MTTENTTYGARGIRRMVCFRAAIFIFHLSLFILHHPEAAQSQYYSWGNSPVTIRWRQIKTPDIQLIYPSTFEQNARRALWYFDTIRPYISLGYTHGTMRSPVVLHTQNMSGNGMVMWAPRRIELLAAPGSSYSEPWLKQLIVHEYRHNVQYNNLNQSTLKVFGWLLGDQIRFLGVAYFGVLFLEGDAVMAETEMSSFGRGLQPSFTMHYRAVGDVGGDHYSKDYWFCGSYRDFVPDHYRLGYQIIRWSYNHHGYSILDTLSRYISRNPIFIPPMAHALKKYYGTTKYGMYQRTFTDLNAHWASLPKVEDTSCKIPTPWTSYVTYQWPLWLDDRHLITFKKDFDRTWRIVRTDIETGDETLLAYTGAVSSRPTLSGNTLAWTEFRSSTLWEERVNSRLCFLDLESGRKSVHRDRRQIIYPVAIPGGEFAYVVYNYSGFYSIVRGLEDIDWEIELPLGMEVNGLAWDDETEKLYFIGLDDGGMWLGRVDEIQNSDSTDESNIIEADWRRLTPSRHITISDLVARGGKLWFGSIVSGKDEAHYYDLSTDTEYRISESAFGSFQPSPDAHGNRIALTTYDRHGYHLAVQSTEGAVEQEKRTLPVNLVNPDWKRWEIPKMDSLVYTAEHASRSGHDHRHRRYNRLSHLFNVHSWVPLDLYPPKAIDEADLTMNLGATVMSQNLLSDTETWLSYGWGRRGGSALKGGLSYSGLGPVMEVKFTWGGAWQNRYTSIPAGFHYDRKKYFSVTPRISLPMVVGSGYHYRTLTPAVEYQYNNGLIFEKMGGTLGKLTRGVGRLRFDLTYLQQTRMAQKDLLPRWGFAVRGSYVMNPANSGFKSLWSVYGRAYTPGILPHHSTTVRFAWQQTVGNGPYMFHIKEVFPRGAKYNFSTRRWAAGSVEYQFPFWYPEGGITSIIYFKRIRLNLYCDYARWEDYVGQWSPLYAYGGDIIMDVSPFRTPASSNVSLKITLGGTSDSHKPYVNFGITIPL